MLSESALAELERRAGAPDKRQAYLEAWLTTPALSRAVREAEMADQTFGDGVSSPSFDPDETLKRANRKTKGRAAVEAGSPRPAKLCDHGVPKSNCKYAKCRGT